MCGWTRPLMTSPGNPGKVLAIPVPAGKSLPELPVSGINLVAALTRTSRRTSDRARLSVDRARPFDIRFHQDRPAAQSFSDTSALTGIHNGPMAGGSAHAHRPQLL